MKKFLSIVILISILVGTAFLVTGCNKKDEDNTYFEKISLYYGSTSLNYSYKVEDGILQGDKQYGGKNESKEKRLETSQIEKINNMIKKHTLLEEVFDKDNNNSTGGANAYYTIILKNDKKRYHSDKEGGLVKELNDYFKEILEF
jgi:hypothetical protein